MSVVTTDVVELDTLPLATGQVSEPDSAHVQERPPTAAADNTISFDVLAATPEDPATLHNCQDEPSTNHNRAKIRDRCLTIIGSTVTSNVLVLPGLLVALLGLVWMLLSQRWTVRNDRLQDCLNFRQVGIYNDVCNSTIQSGLPSFWNKRELHTFVRQTALTADHAAVIALKIVLTLTAGILTLLWYRPKISLFKPILSMVRVKPTSIKNTYIGAGWETGYLGTESGPLRMISSPDFEDGDVLESWTFLDDGSFDYTSEPMPTVQLADDDPDIPETAEELSAKSYRDNLNEVQSVQRYIDRRLAVITVGTKPFFGTSMLSQDITVEASWLLRALAAADVALSEWQANGQQMPDDENTYCEDCFGRYSTEIVHTEQRLNDWFLKYEIDVNQVHRSSPSDVADRLQQVARKPRAQAVSKEPISPRRNGNEVPRSSRLLNVDFDSSREDLMDMIDGHFEPQTAQDRAQLVAFWGRDWSTEALSQSEQAMRDSPGISAETRQRRLQPVNTSHPVLGEMTLRVPNSTAKKSQGFGLFRKLFRRRR